MLKLLLLVLAAANLAGCAELARDRRDAPWDPKPGQTLFDQIPAWDERGSVCGGQMTEAERRATGASPRC